jgi:hypothetical protein
MMAAGHDVVLPPVPANYIVEWWRDIGPVVHSGMGDGPIGWQDMAAWSALSGIDLEFWEAQTIRRMSLEYLAERQEAKKPQCFSPMSREKSTDPADKMAAQFAALSASLKGNG